MSKRVLLAAPRSFCAGVARLRRVPVGEPMVPPRAPSFKTRLRTRAAAIAAWPEDEKRGNLTVSPGAPSLTRTTGGYA
jgi:hypothetical protein